MDKFKAQYTENGIRKVVFFNKSDFDEDRASEWLKSKGVKNFFFFFDPTPPRELNENTMLLAGDVGFDITFDSIMPLVEQGKTIVLDTFGGDSWEALKIRDAIIGLKHEPSIGILGSCMSAGMQILLSTPNRWMTPNSRGLIHNPWAVMAGDDAEFRSAADNLEREKLEIANIYTEISGKPLDYILDLMKKEQVLTSKEMLELNFVKSTKFDNLEKLINEEEMIDEQSKEKLNVIEKTLNSIKNMLFKPKNIVIQDVNGVELDFGDIETQEQIQVGSVATVDGSPATGEFVLNDGTVYVFEAGSLIEIREPQEDQPMEELQAENEALKQEVDELKAQNLEMQNKVTSLEADQAKVSEKFNTVVKDFEEFKNKFSDEKPEINTPPVEEEKKKKFSYKKAK